jgi:class 3 adenylate cyclase/tetratricopeptide (TPR) repeat protein
MISDWLRNLGLQQYEATFRENRIDEQLLPKLTAEDLKDLGVLLVGDRRRLLDAISALRAETPATVGTSVSKSGTPEGGRGQKPHEAERRQLTIMFCDLVGSTTLSTRLDPEDLRSVIGAYHHCCTQLVERNGGFIAKYMGDGVVAYFGYPRAHEHDAERAVRAGLSLVDEVPKLDTGSQSPLQVRVGIATGLVVVGDLLGEGAAQEQAVVGETPNLAARLQGLAEPGTVVIGSSTHKLTAGLFEYRGLGSVTLKGFPETVPAWRVLRESIVESRFEAQRAAGLTPMVGRGQELELLLSRWDLAAQGKGQAVILVGEPGIGKSRIAQAIQERLQGEPCIRVRYFCSPHHQDSPFHPIINQLERAAGFHRDDAPDAKLAKLEVVLKEILDGRDEIGRIAELLSLPIDGRYQLPPLSPLKRKEKTLEALLAPLTELTKRHAVLVLFEDVHWIDPSSLELLSLMVGRLVNQSAMLVITARPEFNVPWPKEANVTAIPLTRLDRREAATLVQWIAGEKALPDEVLNQILGRTDGVPLFIEELTRTVLESGLLREEDNTFVLTGPLPPVAIPTTLHASLLARLDRLAPAREAAQIGAALGRRFSHELIASVALMPADRLEDALDQLVAAELMFRRGTPPGADYTFKHALVQDAAYSTLLRGQRQQLHSRIASTLEHQFPEIAAAQPEVVAQHLTEAGLSEPAIGWWRKAGELALRRSAFGEAIAHLDKAIGMAERLPDGPESRVLRLRLQITKGNSLIAARGHHAHETSAAFARAREIASGIEDAPERFSAYYGLWVGQYTRAELAYARESAEAFLQDAQRQPQSPEAGIAHRSYGMTCWYQGDFVGARVHMEQALEIYDSERDRELVFRFGQDYGITSMSFLALTLWPLGDVDHALRLAEDSVTRAIQSRHVPTIYLSRNVIVGALELMRGDSRRAGPHLEASLSLAREHGMQLPLLTSSYCLSWVRWHAGIVGAEAAEEMLERRALIRKQHYRYLEPLYAKLLADVQSGPGRVESALDTVDEALADVEETGQHWFDSELHRARGELLLKSESPNIEAAEQAFARSMEVARSQHARSFELRAALALARLRCSIGRHEIARELLLPAMAGFSEGPEVPEMAEANRLIAGLPSL